MSLLTAAEQAAYNFNPKCNDFNTGWAVLCEKNVVNERSSCLTACEASDGECLKQCEVDFDLSLRECPCRERCFKGCPCLGLDCRPHVDSNSAPVQDKRPNASLTEPVFLLESDEFNFEYKTWEKITGGSNADS